jgi:hypothetical protein
VLLARRALGKGWRLSSKHENRDGSIVRTYYPVGEDVVYIPVHVILDPSELPEGSCKKVLVEETEEMVKRQVYKIVCT